MPAHIPTLILIGRPAAGKSEIIAFLKGLSADERRETYHLGPFVEVDDFPMLWAWFEEDRILVDMGQPRLHTTDDGYFSSQYLWNVLIRRLDLEYRKLLADDSEFIDNRTAIVEFSRGTEHGGYREAFSHFSKELLRTAAILYIDVSYEESLRKNRKRFNPDRPHSILEHALPDEKLERLYGDSDWSDLTSGSAGRTTVNGVEVPYVAFPNEDDVTTTGGVALAERLEACLRRLAELRDE